TKVGNYHFIVTEKIGDNAAIVYSTVEHKIIVSVTVGDNANLVATAKIYGTETAATDADFTNTYNIVQSAQLELKGTKNFASVARALEMGDYSFTISEKDSEGNFDLIAIVKNSAGTAANQANTYTAPISFGRFEYKAVGTHEYLIKEIVPDSYDTNKFTYDTTEYTVIVNVVDPDGDGKLETQVTVNNTAVAGDTSDDVVFSNAYNPTPIGTTAIKGKKYLINNINQSLPLTESWKEVFNFALYQTDSTYSVTGLTPAATIKNINTDTDNRFNDILANLKDYKGGVDGFNKPGEYYFVLNETAHSVSGDSSVTIDSTVYRFKVVVTDTFNSTNAAEKGTLKATYFINDKAIATTGDITFDNAFYFTNRQTPLEGKGEIVLDKSMVDVANAGYDMSEFRFVLCSNPAAECTGENCANAANHTEWDVDSYGDGKIEIEYTEMDAGNTYTYYLWEKAGDNTSITYDKTMYKVTIAVNRANGALDAVETITKIKGKDGVAVAAQNLTKAEFVNDYAVKSTELAIEGTKVLNGLNLKNGDFKFALYNAAVGTDGSWSIDGEAISTVKNVGDTFKFAQQTYSVTGDYYYIIKEIAGEEDRYNG
ncbi:MAG: hypothetical protein IJ339_02115, partial [Oscillospiraceae bacterium]|nr:hypothetical protein [Oscillospiraceae bacterium]